MTTMILAPLAAPPLRAFHGDPDVKAFYLDRVRAHRAADELVQGQYWEDGKGCGVGCTIHGDDHARYEVELGIPTVLAYVEDRIFEQLPASEAIDWPEQFLAAIPVGADLAGVFPALLKRELAATIRGTNGRHERLRIAWLMRQMRAGAQRDHWDVALLIGLPVYAKRTAGIARARALAPRLLELLAAAPVPPTADHQNDQETR